MLMLFVEQLSILHVAIVRYRTLRVQELSSCTNKLTWDKIVTTILFPPSIRVAYYSWLATARHTQCESVNPPVCTCRVL